MCEEGVICGWPEVYGYCFSPVLLSALVFVCLALMMRTAISIVVLAWLADIVKGENCRPGLDYCGWKLLQRGTTVL